MKAAFDRVILKQALDVVGKIVPKKDVPILGHAKLEVTEDLLKISATDQITSVEVTAPPKRVSEPGTILIPVHDLIACLASSSSPVFVIWGEDGICKALAVGQARWSWKTPSLSQFPKIDALQESVVYLLDREHLLRALSAVKSAAARGTFHPRLEQIGIRKGKVQASDGRRYHEANLPNSDMLDVALPVRFVDEVMPLLERSDADTIELGVPDETTISVRAGDVMVATRKSQQVFPDIAHAYLIPAMANNTELKITRTDLLGAIRRLRISADPSTKAIRLTLGETQYDSVDVSTRQQPGDWAQERVTASWPGGARTMMFNHEHLSSLLQLFEDEKLVLKFGEDAKFNPSSVLIRSDDRAGVLQQVRVDWWRK